jgi:hypothetical protein
VVVRAPVDGYTLLMVHALNAVNATLYEKPTSISSVMVARPSFPAKTVTELIG